MMPVNGTSYSKPVPFLGLYVEYNYANNQPGKLPFDCLAMSQVQTGLAHELPASQNTSIIQMLI